MCNQFHNFRRWVPAYKLQEFDGISQVRLILGGKFIQGFKHLLTIVFLEGRKADFGVFGFFAPEALDQDQHVLGSKEKWFELVLHKLLLGDLNGVLPAGKQAYRIKADHQHLPLVVVGDKVGALQVVDPVYDDVNSRDKDGHMIFGEPELRFIKPGKKYNRQNDQ